MKRYEDFIPKSDSGKLMWLKNFLLRMRETLATTRPSMPEEEIVQLEEEIKEYIESLEDVERKRYAAQAATSRKNELEGKTIKRVRNIAQIIKVSSGYDSAIIAQMGIICKGYRVDEKELKPSIKAKVKGSEVIIQFNKNHHFNVAFYCRFPGEEFSHIGNGLTSPFIDNRPLIDPLQPERREYMAMYTNFKENLGIPSSIVSVVFGG